MKKVKKLFVMLLTLELLVFFLSCNNNTDDSKNTETFSDPAPIPVDSGTSAELLDAPQNLKVSNITYLGADLTWEPVQDADSYFISMGHKTWTEIDNYSSTFTSDTFYRITNEIPGRTIEVSVSALPKNGSSASGKESSISITFPESDADLINFPYPNDFKLKGWSENTITLSWSRVDSLFLNKYYIYMSDDGENYILHSEVARNETSITLFKLRENKKYYFKIASKYGGIITDYLPVISQYSPVIIEAVPENRLKEKKVKVTVKNVTSSSVTLSWDAINNVNSYYVSYGFNRYDGRYGVTENTKYLLCGNKTSCTIENLSPNVEYSFSISSPLPSDDNMMWIHPIDGTNTFTTKAGSSPTQTPQSVKARTNGSAITVSWSPVTNAKEYYVYVYNYKGILQEIHKETSTKWTYAYSSGSKLYFAVRAYSYNGYYSNLSSKVSMGSL